jgi:toxin secretion/phage lysis holin
MQKSVFAVGSFAGLMALFRGAPEYVHTWAFVAFSATCVDTLLGVAAAMACRQLRSKRMRERLTSKLIQFAIILSFGLFLTILTETYWPLGASFTALIAIEMTSMLENLVRLEQYGVPLGPASKLIQAVSNFFDLPITRRTTSVGVVDSGSDNPVVTVVTSEQTGLTTHMRNVQVDVDHNNQESGVN